MELRTYYVQATLSRRQGDETHRRIEQAILAAESDADALRRVAERADRLGWRMLTRPAPSVSTSPPPWAPRRR